MKPKVLCILFALGLAVVWVLGGGGGAAVAAPRAEEPIEAPSAPAAELHVCPSGCTYSSIQDAVDAAHDGDVIKVAAGTYSGVNDRGGLAQIVYIDKAVIIRGGYAIDNWTTSDPENNPTTLDAGGQGRVLYITGSISPTVEGLRMTGGNAAGLFGGPGDSHAGGGVYLSNATAIISDNLVFGNTADYGGGVYLEGSNAMLSGNIVSGNTAESMYGGGLYLTGSDATLSDNTITDNTASAGGGLSLDRSDATLSGNTITDNTAEYGGGLYLYYSPATLSGNTVSDNTATWDGAIGGGLLLQYSAATLSGNIVSGNIAEDNGGGLYLTYSDAVLINNTVSDNQATDDGGGFYIENSSPRLLHTTIARNGAFGGSGDGSGVYVAGEWEPFSTVTMTNTVLVSHTVGIYVESGNTAILESTLWNGNTTDWNGEGTVGHNNDHTGNPAFVDPDAGDYHIGLGSKAIDAGVDAGVSTDIDGDPRPAGMGFDIGADEYYYPALEVVKQAYPDLVETGAPLTYTISVANTGNVDLHATITDTLLFSVTLGGTLIPPGGTVGLPNGMVAITWTAVITAPGGVWTGMIYVTAAEGHEGPLTNLVEVATKEGVAGKAIVIVNAYKIYLPMVIRNSP